VRRQRGRLDPAEILALLMLGIIGLWGVWFGIQSVVTLWWPLNLGYLLAGVLVAAISALVARALLSR
jgi:hypothetical protein